MAALFMSGCAVAATANVDMPESYASGAGVRPLAARMQDAEQGVLDISAPETEIENSAPAANSSGIMQAPLQPAIATFQSDAIPEIVIPPLQEALIEPVAATEPSPSPSAAPEQTPEPAPEKTPSFNIKESDPEDGYVQAKTVNLRSGPDTDYDILGEYERYDTLTITGKSGDWYYVKIDGEKGFMLQEYVEKGAVPTPSPSPSPTPKPTKTPKPTAEPTPEPTPTQAPLVPSEPSANASGLSDELYLAAQLVNEETGVDGYLAVANVIYNRWKNSSFPNTISGVIFQSNQFTPADSEAELRAVTPSAGAISAVNQIFVNGNLVLPENVLYFRAARKGTSWRSHTYFATIGGNAFFY